MTNGVSLWLMLRDTLLCLGEGLCQRSSRTVDKLSQSTLTNLLNHLLINDHLDDSKHSRLTNRVNH